MGEGCPWVIIQGQEELAGFCQLTSRIFLSSKDIRTLELLHTEMGPTITGRTLTSELGTKPAGWVGVLESKWVRLLVSGSPVRRCGPSQSAWRRDGEQASSCSLRHWCPGVLEGPGVMVWVFLMLVICLGSCPQELMQSAYIGGGPTMCQVPHHSGE